MWKYALEVTDGPQSLSMPKGDIKHVGCQGLDLCLWVEASGDSQDLVTRTFSVYGTGQHVSSGQYVGTVQMPVVPLVWHIYEQL